MAMPTAQSAESKVAQPLFFETHHDAVVQLGRTVGLADNFADSLESAIATTQPWTKGDHTHPSMTLQINREQSGVLQGLFVDFGLKQADPLPAGHYDHVLVPGAVQVGNNGRIKFMKESLLGTEITADEIILLGGQRKVFDGEEIRLKEDLQAIQAQGISDSWVDALESDTSRLQWETDFMRLAAVKHLGSLAVKQVHLRVLEPDSPSPYDAVKQYDFEWQNLPLKLMHTLATQRPNGENRHTTESCVLEWLSSNEIRQDARIAFISTNPHRGRMAKSSRRTLVKAGRADIQLVAAGPQDAPGLSDKLFLGEVARNLYEDQFLV